ncbi:MAG: M48 family metalloprotease [Gaiellales bacterium]
MRRTAAWPLLLLALIPLAWWLWQAQLPGSVPSVPAREIFTPAQIARARDYRGPSYMLDVLALVLPAVAGVGLAIRGGERLAIGRRPALAGAIAAFLFTAITAAAALPVEYVLHVRAHNRGIDLQSDPAWLGSALAAIVVFSAGVAVVYVIGRALARRAQPPWLVVGLAAWAGVALLTAIQPIAVDPLFMSTHRIASPSTVALVSGLERRMDAHPASVTVSDASSRTTAENAFVDGLGPTVRMVIDDTTLRESTPAELQAVVAHELGHVKRMHTLKGVLWFGVLALPALWIIWYLLEPVARRRYAGGLLDPRAAALLLAGVLVASTLLTPVENLISRRYEAEADWAALRATHNGAGMAALQRQLALSGIESLQPPGWAVDLLFDHPPVMSRIAVARSVQRQTPRTE